YTSIDCLVVIENVILNKQAIHSVAWHHEGKQFICSHSDGTLTIWNVKSPGKPAQTITPHGKQPKDGKKPEPCKPILKVEYKTTRAGDPFMILSGGLSYDTVGRRPCLTVMHGKSTAVLEMDYPIVDFLTLCETPYPNEEPMEDLEEDSMQESKNLEQ
ncbi:hypothetical protein Z043_121700, partial [Scleropages formosus]